LGIHFWLANESILESEHNGFQGRFVRLFPRVARTTVFRDLAIE
jgi:hypothetical protein